MDHTVQTAAPYAGPERRAQVHLTDPQIEQIATRAARKAVEDITKQAYQAVGRGVIERLAWIVGALTVGIYLWAVSRGWIKVV